MAAATLSAAHARPSSPPAPGARARLLAGFVRLMAATAQSRPRRGVDQAARPPPPRSRRRPAADAGRAWRAAPYAQPSFAVGRRAEPAVHGRWADAGERPRPRNPGGLRRERRAALATTQRSPPAAAAVSVQKRHHVGIVAFWSAHPCGDGVDLVDLFKSSTVVGLWSKSPVTSASRRGRRRWPWRRRRCDPSDPKERSICRLVIWPRGGQRAGRRARSLGSPAASSR